MLWPTRRTSSYLPKSPLIFVNRHYRILLEAIAPVPLGAILMMLTTSRASESVGEVVKAFPIFLMVSYVFGIVPSLLYAGIMELWFCNKLNEKLGCILTILFSVLLGFLSGFIVFVFSKPFTKGTASDMLHIAGIGALVGLVIGIYLARRCRAT